MMAVTDLHKEEEIERVNQLLSQLFDDRWWTFDIYFDDKANAAIFKMKLERDYEINWWSV